MKDLCKVCFLDGNGKVSSSFDFTRESPSMSLNSGQIVPISICPDDTIQIVKEKIIYGVQGKIPEFSGDEMYMFVIKERPFKILDWYKNVTQNEKKPLRTEEFCQLLIHFSEMDKDPDPELVNILNSVTIEEKEILTYEDVLSFSWFQNLKKSIQKIPLGFRMEIPIGQKTKRILMEDETFTANPYELLPTLDIQKIHQSKKVVLFEKELLFHYCGKSLDNTIYVCLAGHLLQEENPSMAQYYFPHLYRKNILTPLQLTTQKQQLIEQHNPAIYENEELYHEKDLFYSVENEAKTPYPFSSQGVKSFVICIENNEFFQSKLRVPIEAIFKNIHATENSPYLEFFSGVKQDSMVRMLYNETTQKGDKIPILNAKTVLDIGKQKTLLRPHISLYVIGDHTKPHSQLEVGDFIQVILEQNGNIQLRASLEIPKPYDILERWLRENTEPVFNNINEYLHQSGYHIRHFETLQDPHVHINTMSYVFSLELTKMLDLEKNTARLSSILKQDSILQQKASIGETTYRYIQVEYYQPMDEEEEYISQLLKVTQEKGLVERQLRQRFPEKSMIEITNMLNDYAAKYRTVYGRFIHRKSDTLVNAGFPVTIKKATFGNSCSIHIDNVDMIEYVLLFPKIFGSILRLSQYPDTVSDKWLKAFSSEKPRIVNTTTVLDEDIIKNEEAVVSLLDEDPQKDESMIMEDDEDEDEDIERNLDDYMGLLDNIEEEEEEDEEIEEENDTNEDSESFDILGKMENEENIKNKEESDEEESEQEEEESDRSLSLGGAPNKNVVRNYFTERIKNKDPKLFKEMNGYSKICQESQRRQPIIISKKEKEEYDEKYGNKKGEDHPYQHKTLQYGKDGNKDPLYYICPRFWCTKPGKEGPLTKEQVDNGECGKIITDTGKQKPDEYVYSRDFSTYTGKEIRGLPSFAEKNGICYPCCFKNKPKNNIDQCMKDEVSNENNAENPVLKMKTNKVVDKANQVYILGYNKREALAPGRHGLIPLPIQQFMNIDSNSCIDDGDLRTVKTDCPIMIRYGVENTPNNNQSFLSCLADLYCYERNINQTISVNEFRKILATSLTLDTFVGLQNGTLVTQFAKKKTLLRDKHNIDIHLYRNEKIYKNVDKREESQSDFLKHCILAFELFQVYLNDPNVRIDHTFLWDLVSRPNPKLFWKGLNLAIFELMQDDITNKVKLVCPTTHYMPPIFDEKRPTVLLLKNENLYEPLYRLEKQRRTNIIPLVYTKYFLMQDKSIGDIPTILKTIKRLTETQCISHMKRSNTFKFKENVQVETLFQILRDIDISVKSRVVNYQAKTIALGVLYSGKECYLPCFPSASELVDELTDMKWMEDESLWNDYETTMRFLNDIYSKTNKKVASKPAFRIVENNMIVGILTWTNQFVPINPPIQNVHNDIPELKQNHYIMADKTIMQGESGDGYEDKSIQYIHLENQFYNAFRTTLRILMQLYQNRPILEKMHHLCHQDDIPIEERREKMEKHLRKISKNHISFQEYDEEVLKDLTQIYSCEINPGEKPYCMVQTQGVLDRTQKPTIQGTLLLPEKHLVTEESNDSIYYIRMADELLRHRRVHLFMFYPEQYLNIQNHEYQIQEAEEFLILKSLLTQEYFKTVEKHVYGLYAKTLPYDHPMES